MQQDLLSGLDAADRLRLVRTALLALADPGDPQSALRSPLGAWLPTFRRARYNREERLGLFDDATADPLFIIAFLLCAEDTQEIGRRSRAWPADLRRRWTYCQVLGALNRA